MTVDSPSPCTVEPFLPDEDRSLARLAWRCRRGMLENDLVLSRFLARRGDSLTGADLVALDALLDLPDNDLWQIISGQIEPTATNLYPLVMELRAA